MAYEYALTKGTILRHSSVLGRESVYTIEDVLGQGGFGITYLASSTISVGNTEHKLYFAIKEFFIKDQCWREHSALKSKDNLFAKLLSFIVQKKPIINENEYVMKYSPAARLDVEECLRDFIEEANRLKTICRENEHIVKVNEIFEDNGTAYYVMEFLNGGSLRDKVLKKGSSLDEAEAISLINPIAHAVAHIHGEYKLLHCDISPDNIMLRKNENGSFTPVLIDFGESLHFNSRGDLTTTHNSVGAKDGYAPQEQYRGVKSFDPRIDVYALGATLFYLVTGKKPISSFDISKEYIEKYLPQDMSEQVRDTILSAMAKDKVNRTKDVNIFIKGITGNEMGEPQFVPIKSPELPIGYILKDKGKVYEIVSVIKSESYYIQYKALQTEEGKQSRSGHTRRAQYDIYELFDQQKNHRQEDKIVVADSDISSSRKLFLSLCKKITKGVINGEFREGSTLGWATFASNNTFYLVDTHYREPLPWKKMFTSAGVGIGGTFLVVGVISIYNSIKEASIKERLEMSQRLTEAIATNNFAILQEFVVEHDSTRAYVPYAKLCLENSDFDTAEKYANDSLINIIRQKKDSLAMVTQNVADEQIFDIDSLYNVVKTQFNQSKYEESEKNANELLKKYPQNKKVIALLGDIRNAKHKKKEELEIKKKKELEQKQKEAYRKGKELYNTFLLDGNTNTREQAINYLKSADPNNAEVQRMLKFLNDYKIK